MGVDQNTQTICNPFPEACLNKTDATFDIVYFCPQQPYAMCVNIGPSSYPCVGENCCLPPCAGILILNVAPGPGSSRINSPDKGPRPADEQNSSNLLDRDDILGMRYSVDPVTQRTNRKSEICTLE